MTENDDGTTTVTEIRTKPNENTETKVTVYDSLRSIISINISVSNADGTALRTLVMRVGEKGQDIINEYVYAEDGRTPEKITTTIRNVNGRETTKIRETDPSDGTVTETVIVRDEEREIIDQSSVKFDADGNELERTENGEKKTIERVQNDDGSETFTATDESGRKVETTIKENDDGSQTTKIKIGDREIEQTTKREDDGSTVVKRVNDDGSESYTRTGPDGKVQTATVRKVQEGDKMVTVTVIVDENGQTMEKEFNEDENTKVRVRTDKDGNTEIQKERTNDDGSKTRETLDGNSRVIEKVEITVRSLDGATVENIKDRYGRSEEKIIERKDDGSTVITKTN